MPVIKLGNGVGTEMFQLLDLGKISGIDQQRIPAVAPTSAATNTSSPNKIRPTNFRPATSNRWKVFIDDLHENHLRIARAAFGLSKALLC